MTSLLERARAEVSRRAQPLPVAVTREMVEWLRRDELVELQAALEHNPVDVETVVRMEQRSRRRLLAGWGPLTYPEKADTEGWDRLRQFESTCIEGAGDWCPCLLRALDGERPVRTRAGLEHQAQIHHRRHWREHYPPPPKPRKPRARKEPEPLAVVLPFRRRTATLPPKPRTDEPQPRRVLDPALQARVPLEFRHLAARLAVPVTDNTQGGDHDG